MGDRGHVRLDRFDRLKTITISNLKEQIRYAYVFASGSDGDFFWVECPAPMWQVF